jgi:hypothetical protein
MATLPVSISPSPSFFDACKEAFSNPLNAVEGSIWGLCLITDGWELGTEITARVQSCFTKAGEQPPACDNKKLFFASWAFVGDIANLLSWAGRLALISLGPLFVLVSTVSYVSRIVLSLIRGGEALKASYDYSVQAQQTSSPEEAKRAGQQQILALLKGVARVALVVWSVLSLIALFYAAPILVPLISYAFTISFVLAICEISFSLFVQKVQKTPAQATS